MKYTYDYVKNEFEKRGYVLLSKEYINTTEKLEYICLKHQDKGSQFISFSKFHSNHQGCYYCGREKTAKSKRKKFNKDHDRKLCESKGFEYIDTYRKNHIIYIKFICKKHKDLGPQSMRIYNMERDIKGCKYCAGKELPESYVLNKAKNINPYIQLCDPYKNLTTRMKCLCTKHNCETYKTMQQILSGQGCKICGIEKLSKQSYLSLEEYSEKVYHKNRDIKVLSYSGMAHKAKFFCKICGHVWESSAVSMVVNGRQCPCCQHYYNGERIISELLSKWGYKHELQKRFSGCKDSKTLPFDIFLCDFNTAIEYDGEQHFKPIFGKESFEKTILHDNLKTDYCKKHHINLIRITCYDDDIEYKLFDELSKLGIILEEF